MSHKVPWRAPRRILRILSQAAYHNTGEKKPVGAGLRLLILLVRWVRRGAEGVSLARFWRVRIYLLCLYASRNAFISRT
jgi:hypothetical protein